MGELRRIAPRKADMDRAVKLALSNGLTVTGVQVGPDGGFTILTASGSGAPADELEEWRARRDARKAKGSEPGRLSTR